MRRAELIFGWQTSRKKTGIDLFKMLQVDRHSILDTGATCKTGVIEHVSERPDSKKEAPTHLADVVTALQNGLATYGATTQQLRDRYGIVPHLFVPNRSDQEKDEAFFQQLETDIENISV